MRTILATLLCVLPVLVACNKSKSTSTPATSPVAPAGVTSAPEPETASTPEPEPQQQVDVEDLDIPELLRHAVDYEEVEVTSGGTVSGTVAWDGELPSVDPFPINKNPEVCAMNHPDKNKPSPRLEVDGESKGVKNVVVFLADVTKGKPLATLETPVLNQIGCQYDPHIVFIENRGRLGVKSSDKVLHNVHVVGPSEFNKAFPLADIVIEGRMRKPGLSRIQCDAGHAWMSGFIFVVQHPYFVLTDESGAFQLTDVPPGEYHLVVWHEAWDVTEAIKDSGGAITKYVFGAPKVLRKNVTIEAGGDTKLECLLSDAEGLAEKGAE